MEWFRWYHGAISDPKWPLIARKSKQNIGTVVSVWAALLEYASQASPRGAVDGFDAESVDALFGYEDGTVNAVIVAMKTQGLIVETPCNANETHDETHVTFRIVSWEKRQVKREREDNSTARVRKHRLEKNTNENKDLQNVTPCNANETPRNAQNRTEKSIKNTPLPPTGDGEQKPKKKRTAKDDSYTPEFDAAWNAYPRKDGKRKAFEAWQKAITREMPVADMPAHIEARTFEPDWRKENGQYIPHMATWLNRDGWLDAGAKIECATNNDDHPCWNVDFWGNPLPAEEAQS